MCPSFLCCKGTNPSNEKLVCVPVNSHVPYSRLHKNVLGVYNVGLSGAVMDVHQLKGVSIVQMLLRFCTCPPTGFFLVHRPVLKEINTCRPFFNFYLVSACAKAGSFALLWFECRMCGNANVPDCANETVNCPVAITHNVCVSAVVPFRSRVLSTKQKR